MIILNPDQRGAVDEGHRFLEGPEPFMLIDGSAGTGKSTCVQTLVRESRASFCMTAPTNKATKVLREMSRQELDDSVDSATTYSLLGLRLDSSGEYRTVSAAEGANKAGQYDVVVVDEGSMVNKSLWGHISLTAQEEGVKFLIMGDGCQLPPVGEERSRALDVRYARHLSKVERHDNQILTIANHLRDCQGTLSAPTVRTDCDERGGVYALNYKTMRKKACDAFLSDSYQANPGSIKVIAWRNSTVAFYNQLIREAMYGEKVASEAKFQMFERVVSCQAVMAAGEVVMSTDEEGTVQGIEVEQHPIYRDLTCYKLQVEAEFGDSWVTCWVIHESSERAYAKLLGDLADKAKARTGSWQAFWAAKELIHDIRPCHAITAHRAQGSTYDSAFVDLGDIMVNRNRLEALQCAYVGFSRPRRILCVC